jgi:hypothetical protein
VDVLEVATVALALATFVLAGVSVWNTLEVGWRQQRSAVRAALLEQYDNTRRWHQSRPGVRTTLAEKLTTQPTPTNALEQFIIRVDLPPDLTALLVWLIEQIDVQQQQYADDYADAATHHLAKKAWDVQLDHLQTIVQLVAGHASSRWSLRAAARSFAGAPWLNPVPGVPDWRENSRKEQEVQRGRPPFPSGAPYAAAHPHARDVASRGSETALQLTRDAPGRGLGELYRDRLGAAPQRAASRWRLPWKRGHQ